MESLVIAFIVIILAAIGTLRMEHKHRAASLTAEADEAMRSLRGVAKKRAQRYSIPHAVGTFEDTGVHGLDRLQLSQLEAKDAAATPALRVVSDLQADPPAKPLTATPPRGTPVIVKRNITSG